MSKLRGPGMPGPYEGASGNSSQFRAKSGAGGPRADRGVRPTLVLVMIASLGWGAEAPRRTVDHYQVSLRIPAEGLFAREEMQIEFRVEDLHRPDPLTGFGGVIRAAPEATIDMPAMRGMPKFTEIAHAEGVPGEYGIHPTFAHGGEYRLRIEIHPPAGQPFPVEFPLTVQDAAPNRKPQPASYRLEVSAQPRKPKAGEPAALRFTVRDRENAMVTDFETVHEALLHLVIVRRDLAHFAHEHPVAQADGSFVLNYTFAAGGDYSLFADLAPRRAGGQLLSARIAVSGSAGPGFDLRHTANVRTTNAGPTTITLLTPEALPVGRTVPIAFALRDTATDRPATDLQPYLGVAGHLLLVHEDAATFVHCHPGDDGELRFLARFPKAGLYRGWLQFQRQGVVWAADFVFRAEETP